MSDSLLDSALSYAKRRWHVFPIHWPTNGKCSCNNPHCENQAKHPLTKSGFKDATTDPKIITEWWTKWPFANIGIATGAISGIVVIDIDNPEAKEEVKKILPSDYDINLVARSVTGRGWHLVFAHPGVEIKNRTGILPKVDVRGDGGYFIVEPSMHVSGKQYRWQVVPGDELRKLPVELYQLISRASGNGNGHKPPLDLGSIFEGVPEGERDDKLFRAVCKIRSQKLPEDFALSYALESARKCEPPFPESKVLEKVRRVYSNPGYVPKTANGNGVSRHLTPYSAPILEEGVMCLDEESEPDDEEIPFSEAAWSGLFGRWRDITAPCTEAPLESLWSVFLLTAGLMLGRNVWRSSPRPLYPNFYLLLLGQTGDSRKSTVIWLAEELLQRVGADVEIIKGIVSTEGLLEALAKKDETRALGYADEFRSILSVAKRKGTQDIIPRLQSLHSCPHQDTITRREESTTAVRPFFSFITATPQAFVEDLLGELEITGGFLNRFLMISGEVQNPKPRVKPPSEAAWQSVVGPLREIRQRVDANPCQMDFDPEAEQLWDTFYIEWRNKRRSLNPRTADLSARTFEHVLKIALVYSVLAGERMMSPRSLATAIELGGWLERNTLSLFGETGLDRRTKAQNAIIKRLKKAKDGRMYVRDLQRYLSGIGITGSDFRDGLKILADNDHVKVYEIQVLSGQKRKIAELIPLDTLHLNSIGTGEKVSGVMET